jgi:hypothetical protein
MREKDLAKWIDSHYPPEPTVINADGTLGVSCTVVHLATGAAEIERANIPATMAAACAWLEH